MHNPSTGATPMTPPLGAKLTDTDENPAAGEAYITRDALKLAVLRHKDECDLHAKVDKLRLQQAAGGGALALLTILGPVILAWWLSNRLPAQQGHRISESASSLIPAAQAASKVP